MYRVGMNGARINTAYGTLRQYSLMISHLREIGNIPIIVDLKGPELRIRAKNKRTINAGDVLELGEGKKASSNNDIYDQLHVGDIILVDNGANVAHSCIIPIVIARHEATKSIDFSVA